MAELSVRENDVETVLQIGGGRFTVGRSPENDLVLDGSAVSGRHCMIQTGVDDIRLIDLNSRNGTVVNGERIDGSFSLKDGDVIGVGHAELTFFTEAAPPGPRLIVAGPDMKESALVLTEKTLAIGRLSANNLVLSHSGVSNFHAQVTCADAKYRLQDLGSTNGTRVNGDFVMSVTLSHGDRIEIGPYTLTFSGAGAAVVPPVEPEATGNEAPAAAAGAPAAQGPGLLPPLAPKTGGKVVAAAAAVAGICVLLVLVEAIARRLSGPPGSRAEPGLNLLIGNVSFEKPIGEERTPPDWKVEADVRSVARLTRAVAHNNGGTSLEIQTEQGPALDSAVSCVYAEGIPVDRTRGYNGTFWVKTRERDGLCLAALEWIDMPGGQIVWEDFGTSVGECPRWGRVTVGGIPPDGADRVRLRFLTYGGQGILWVDDAVLHEVPKESVGTVRYVYDLGDCRITMDLRGLLSLRYEDALLIRRSEFVVDMAGVETKQSFSAVGGDYPVMDENGFTVRGRFCNLSSGGWMRFESLVSAPAASVRLVCRIWPEEGGANPTSLRLDLFISPSILREAGLCTIAGGEAAVRDSTFSEDDIDRIDLAVSDRKISLDVALFDTIALRDAGSRGLQLMLSKRVHGVPVGGSADLSLVITPD